MVVRGEDLSMTLGTRRKVGQNFPPNFQGCRKDALTQHTHTKHNKYYNVEICLCIKKNFIYKIYKNKKKSFVKKK